MSASLFSALFLTLCVATALAAKPPARLLGVGSNKCLTLAPGRPYVDYGQVWVGECDDIPANRWQMLDPLPGSLGGQIKDEGSGYCFTVHGGVVAKGTPISLWECVNQPHQQFNWIDRGGEGKMLKDVKSGLCLALEDEAAEDGTQIVLDSCKNQPNAQWKRLPKDYNAYAKPAPTGVRPPPPVPVGDCPFRATSGSVSFSQLPSFDISPGYSITTRTVDSMDNCGKSCLICDGCVAFVYNEQTGSCALKNNKNAVPVSDSNLIAGVFEL